MSLKQVNLMHVLLAGPLLFYIGSKKDKTPICFYSVLGILTLMIPFIVRFNISKPITYRIIINLMHYIVWMPLLGYIVYKKNNLQHYLWPFITLLGITVISIHIYLFAEKMNWINTSFR